MSSEWSRRLGTIRAWMIVAALVTVGVIWFIRRRRRKFFLSNVESPGPKAYGMSENSCRWVCGCIW